MKDVAATVIRKRVLCIDLLKDVRRQAPTILDVREHEVWLKCPPRNTDVRQAGRSLLRTGRHVPAFTKKPLSPSFQLSSFVRNAFCMPAGAKSIGLPIVVEVNGTTPTTS